MEWRSREERGESLNMFKREQRKLSGLAAYVERTRSAASGTQGEYSGN